MLMCDFAGPQAPTQGLSLGVSTWACAPDTHERDKVFNDLPTIYQFVNMTSLLSVDQ